MIVTPRWARPRLPNGAKYYEHPGGIIVIDRILRREEIDAIKQAWKNETKRIVVFHGGVRYRRGLRGWLLRRFI